MRSPAAAEQLIRELRARHPDDGYLAYHAPRYRVVLELLRPHVVDQSRVLDTGYSRLTTMITRHFGIRVDSLGLWPTSDCETEEGFHYRYDLNESQELDRWRTGIGPYDVVVMAEVIEHIHTAPTLVLRYVRSLLADGGVLVLQTPNAAALHKRIKLALGQNPYELIREDNGNPGHFREYTRRELEQYASATGFRVESCAMGNYFDYRFSHHNHKTLRKSSRLKVVNHVYRILPASVQPGITTVLRAS